MKTVNRHFVNKLNDIISELEEELLKEKLDDTKIDSLMESLLDQNLFNFTQAVRNLFFENPICAYYLQRYMDSNKSNHPDKVKKIFEDYCEMLEYYCRLGHVFIPKKINGELLVDDDMKKFLSKKGIKYGKDFNDNEYIKSFISKGNIEGIQSCIFGSKLHGELQINAELKLDGLSNYNILLFAALEGAANIVELLLSLKADVIFNNRTIPWAASWQDGGYNCIIVLDKKPNTGDIEMLGKNTIYLYHEKQKNGGIDINCYYYKNYESKKSECTYISFTQPLTTDQQELMKFIDEIQQKTPGKNIVINRCADGDSSNADAERFRKLMSLLQKLIPKDLLNNQPNPALLFFAEYYPLSFFHCVNHDFDREKDDSCRTFPLVRTTKSGCGDIPNANENFKFILNHGGHLGRFDKAYKSKMESIIQKNQIIISNKNYDHKHFEARNEIFQFVLRDDGKKVINIIYCNIKDMKLEEYIKVLPKDNYTKYDLFYLIGRYNCADVLEKLCEKLKQEAVAGKGAKFNLIDMLQGMKVDPLLKEKNEQLLVNQKASIDNMLDLFVYHGKRNMVKLLLEFSEINEASCISLCNAGKGIGGEYLFNILDNGLMNKEFISRIVNVLSQSTNLTNFSKLKQSVDMIHKEIVKLSSAVTGTKAKKAAIEQAIKNPKEYRYPTSLFYYQCATDSEDDDYCEEIFDEDAVGKKNKPLTFKKN